MKHPSIIISGFSYWLALACYSLWSFGLTAPNLVLSQWQPYWRFQEFMWQYLYNDRTLLATTFALLLIWILTSFSAFLISIWRKHQSKSISRNISLSKALMLLLLFALPLLPSMNALSYDVFNYIFNAHMLVEYGANPHVTSAIQFASDPLVRFMHNVHTPAPYGYGWTALSLIPYTIGSLLGGSFSLTWMLFRIFSLGSILLTVTATWWILRELQWGFRPIVFVAVFLHPLLLIEVISNFHNDLWMMAPALLSLGLLVKRNNSYVRVAVSALMLFVSISVKLASLALVPVWIGLAIWNLFPRYIEKLFSQLPRAFTSVFTSQNIYVLSLLLASTALFLPLLTPRSKFFLPWYLLWSIAFTPFVLQALSTHKIPEPLRTIHTGWMLFIGTLSATVLWRYLPFLKAGQYSASLINTQILLTWIPATVVLFSFCIWRSYQTLRYTDSR